MYEKIKELRQNFQNILAGRRSGDVDDCSVSGDSDNNKNETIMKKSTKKEKLVILTLLLVKIQYQNQLTTKGDTSNVN